MNKLSSIKSDIKSRRVYSFYAVCPAAFIKATPHKAHLTALCGIALKNPLISFNPLCYYQNNQAHTHNLFREHLRKPLKACRNQCRVHCLCHKNYPNRHHLPSLKKFRSKPCPLLRNSSAACSLRHVQ